MPLSNPPQHRRRCPAAQSPEGAWGPGHGLVPSAFADRSQATRAAWRCLLRGLRDALAKLPASTEPSQGSERGSRGAAWEEIPALPEELGAGVPSHGRDRAGSPSGLQRRSPPGWFSSLSGEAPAARHVAGPETAPVRAGIAGFRGACPAASRVVPRERRAFALRPRIATGDRCVVAVRRGGPVLRSGRLATSGRDRLRARTEAEKFSRAAAAAARGNPSRRPAGGGDVASRAGLPRSFSSPPVFWPAAPQTNEECPHPPSPLAGQRARHMSAAERRAAAPSGARLGERGQRRLQPGRGEV